VAAVEELITENIDIWTSAIKRKSSAGRGGGKKIDLYGIKKLRELILDLAVRGLLVPQDSNDEPASELLKRVVTKRKGIAKGKALEKLNTMLSIPDVEKESPIPSSWEFARFGILLDFSGGSQPPKSTFSEKPQEGFVQLIQIRDLGPKPQPVYVPKEKVSKFCTTSDVMIGRYGASVGKVFWGKDGAYNVALIKLHNDFGAYANSFLFTLMNSPLGQNLFSGISRSAQAGFSKSDIENNLLPLPSIPEQHRIVAKVDELMALCDQLERLTETSLTAHQTLVKTLLDALTQAATQPAENGVVAATTPNPFEQAWHRLAEHFDTVFTTDDSIEQLKQTILQLAVMGVLTQSDKDDASVSSLLDTVYAERLVGCKNAKAKNLLVEEYSIAKASIKNNMAFVKASYFCEFITKGTTPSKKELTEQGEIPFLKVYNIVNQKLDFDYKPIFISKETHANKLKRSIIYPGDVLMNIVGPPLGKIAIINEQYPEWNMNQALAVYRPVGGIFNKYIYYVLSTRSTLTSVLKDVKGTAGQDNLSLEQCRNLVIPLPPIEVQHRIVNTIDNLFNLCDQLRTKLTNTQTKQLQITEAITTKAVNMHSSAC